MRSAPRDIVVRIAGDEDVELRIGVVRDPATGELGIGFNVNRLGGLGAPHWYLTGPRQMAALRSLLDWADEVSE